MSFGAFWHFFVCSTQNKTNASLKTEIGWLMRKAPEKSNKEAIFYQREQARLNMLKIIKEP